MTRPKNDSRNSILMMCHPDLSSVFVWLKICCIQVYLFTTFWPFVWLAFVHARSSIGLGTTLESGASPGTSPETGRVSASHWRPLWEGRPTSEVQGACCPWRRWYHVRVPREGDRDVDSEIFDHYAFLGNCPPTPPLSQYSHLLLT